MKLCVECGRELFNGKYSGSCLTRDGKNWTCGDCAKPKDWLVLQHKQQSSQSVETGK